MNGSKTNYIDRKTLTNPSILLTGIVLFSLIGFVNVYADSIAFDTEINLSNNANDSVDAQLITSGSNVYVVWRDGDNIYFINSTDSGASFANSIIDIGDTGVASTFGNPQLAVSGDNIYTIWQESDAIKFINSTDNGVTFASAIVQLSSSTDTTSPQIDFSGSSTVYSIWLDDNPGTPDAITFRKSTDEGLTFDSSITLGVTGAILPSPQFVSAGTNVVVVWQSGSDILFSNSVDSGSSFSTAASIGSGLSSLRESAPQITTSSSGADVYVAWQSNSDILVAHSSNSGASFGAAVDIGNTGGVNVKALPQISTSSAGSSVYVVWQDQSSGTSQINFTKSSDSGSSFAPPSDPSDGNLSSTNGESKNPKLAVSGSNIHVLWEDLSQSANGEIFYRLSTDSGDTFGTFSNISNDSEFSAGAQITASGSTPFIVWQDDSTGEIMFRTGSVSTINIVPNSVQYKISDTASIIITDSSSSGSIISTVSSDTDSSGISITLNEGPTGTFTGSLTFTESGSSSGNTLLASPSDNIIVSFGGINGVSTIYPRSIEFDGGFTLFDLRSIAHVEVTDQNSNLDITRAETINVNIVSDTDTSEIKLTITETGPNTGIFGGIGLSDMIFMIGNDFITTSGSMLINQTSANDNLDSNSIDTTTVDVTSTSNSIGITLTLVETGNDTDLFQGTLFLNSGGADSISVIGGDILTIKHGLLFANAFVLPNPNHENGALIITITPTLGEDVTATYKGESIAAIVFDATAPGGGGGGLVSPGLVVNALGGVGGSGASAPMISLNTILTNTVIDIPLEVEQMVFNQDASVPILPMSLDYFDNFEFPLVINDNGFVLGKFSNTLQTQLLQKDTPVTMQFTVYENEKIQHFSLYTNLRGTMDTISQSNAQILYNDGKPLQIIDPEGFFANAAITVIEEEDSPIKQVLVEITFAKEMDTSHMMIRSWDPNFFSRDLHILNAIKVESGVPEFNPIPQVTEVEVEELKLQTIPKWVKNNAEWWANQQIDDESFVSAIQYLIDYDIMFIPNTETLNSVTEIPDWVKNNAEWWTDNQISDDDFVKAMEWLVANGVITLE